MTDVKEFDDSLHANTGLAEGLEPANLMRLPFWLQDPEQEASRFRE
jgi:hypothetical protein